MGYQRVGTLKAYLVSVLQLVSRHVTEIQEIGFKRLCTELGRVGGLHQILAGNLITYLEPLLNCQCRFNFWGCRNLGAHAQRGLRYLVCECVCVCVSVTQHLTFHVIIRATNNTNLLSGG